MNHQTKFISKGSLIISTSLLLGMISTPSIADSTHFTDDQLPAVSEETTPVETKAAEFKKVIEDFEETASAKNDSIPETAIAQANAELPPISKPEVSKVEEELILAKAPETKAEDVIEEAEATEIVPEENAEILSEQDALPALEETQTEAQSLDKTQPRLEVIEYSTAHNGRSPLGVVESNRDLNTQKWYLFSSARRGIKAPNDVVEIVSIVDEKNPVHRGEEVKALLVEMGMRPENIKIVSARGDDSQAGKIYIFGK